MPPQGQDARVLQEAGSKDEDNIFGVHEVGGDDSDDEDYALALKSNNSALEDEDMSDEDKYSSALSEDEEEASGGEGSNQDPKAISLNMLGGWGEKDYERAGEPSLHPEEGNGGTGQSNSDDGEIQALTAGHWAVPARVRLPVGFGREDTKSTRQNHDRQWQPGGKCSVGRICTLSLHVRRALQQH